MSSSLLEKSKRGVVGEIQVLNGRLGLTARRSFPNYDSISLI